MGKFPQLIDYILFVTQKIISKFYRYEYFKNDLWKKSSKYDKYNIFSLESELHIYIRFGEIEKK